MFISTYELVSSEYGSEFSSKIVNRGVVASKLVKWTIGKLEVSKAINDGLGIRQPVLRINLLD